MPHHVGTSSPLVSPASRCRPHAIVAFAVTVLVMIMLAGPVSGQGRSCQADADCGSSRLDPLECAQDTRLCVPADCVVNSECSSADPTKFCQVDSGRCTPRRGEGGQCVDAFGLADEAICLPGLSCTAGTCRARGAGVSSPAVPTPVPSATASPGSPPPSSRASSATATASRASAPSTTARPQPSQTKSENSLGATRVAVQDAVPNGRNSDSSESSSFSLVGLVIGLGAAALVVLLAITFLSTRRLKRKKKREDEAFLRRVVAGNMGLAPTVRSNSTGTSDPKAPSSVSRMPPTSSGSAYSTAERSGSSVAAPAPAAMAQPFPASHHPPPYPDLYFQSQGYQDDSLLYPPAPAAQIQQVHFAASSFDVSQQQRHDPHHHNTGHAPFAPRQQTMPGPSPGHYHGFQRQQ